MSAINVIIKQIVILLKLAMCIFYALAPHFFKFSIVDSDEEKNFGIVHSAIIFVAAGFAIFCGQPPLKCVCVSSVSDILRFLWRILYMLTSSNMCFPLHGNLFQE